MVLRGNETKAMAEIAERYPVKFDPLKAVVQDFHSIGQALNVASADQRVLVLVAGPKEKTDKAQETLGPIIHHDDFVGRFHVDFDAGDQWKKPIEGEKQSEGVLLIASGEFGLKGSVMKELPLDAAADEIRDALKQANSTFAKTTEKKVYAEHVSKGRREGIKYKNVVPYGEDRDGDGEIDQRGRGGGRSRSGGRSR